mgnify:CR=1 FL=1
MPSFNLQQRLAKLNSGRVGNVAEVSDDLVSTPTTSGWRVAAGTGVLVTGAVTVSTGLDTVRSFTASLSRSTGFATGASEVNALLVGAITTGDVVVTGAFNAFVTGAATLSASGTSTFYWIAFGT